MLITGAIGYFTGYVQFNEFVSLPPTPVFFDIDIGGDFTHGLYTVVFAFLLVTLFDTTGTLIGVAEQGGMMKNSELLRKTPDLLADATATTVGCMFGTSPATAYIESTT